MWVQRCAPYVERTDLQPMCPAEVWTSVGAIHSRFVYGRIWYRKSFGPKKHSEQSTSHPCGLPEPGFWRDMFLIQALKSASGLQKQSDDDDLCRLEVGRLFRV